MDLEVYVGAWALWVWGALGRDLAPLPRLDRPLEHGMDLVLGPVAALIGSVVPDEARRHLSAFTGERTVTRRISAEDDGDRVATAWLGREVALGAESGTVDLSWWDQFHAATAHWRRSDGTTGWLRARIPGASDATVEPGRLTLRWHHDAGGEPAFDHDRPLSDADPVALSEVREGPVTVFTLQVR
jgi:hypothetical protein